MTADSNLNAWIESVSGANEAERKVSELDATERELEEPK